jgi:hypothetical protein
MILRRAAEWLQEQNMHRRGVCRPSLECVAVRHPFLHGYRPVNSAEERDAAMDGAVAAEKAGPRWAEMRTDATRFGSYDTWTMIASPGQRRQA